MKKLILYSLFIGLTAFGGNTRKVIAQTNNWTVDLEVISQIKEEGLQRSKISETLSYMTDVLGARLTNSEDMERARSWVMEEMRRIGLTNIIQDPFMDYGVSWDNEYSSLHMTSPDYTPIVGYPIAHTPSTKGKIRVNAVLANIRSREDAEALRGKLRGMAVLSTPQAVIDIGRFETGTPRRTEEELRLLAEYPVMPSSRRDDYFSRLYPDPPANPEILTEPEKLDFYIEEGAVALLESRSGWPGAVRGFARPGAKIDRWSKEVTLNSIPIIAITPEHYNRMYRILERGIPLEVELEIKNKHGDQVTQAKNVLGEIKGSDLSDQIVMLGAHFDTWHASPNASDNTSGVAVMLEAMRILKAIGVTPRRTIRVALWSGEEQGLWGSRAYVEKQFGDPANPEVGKKPDYDKLSAYFNQDYGPGEYRGIWLQGNEHVREPFSKWMQPLADMGMSTISLQGVGSTDHVPFDEVGLPAFQFLQERVGGTGGHTNLDFFDTLPLDQLKKNAVIMSVFIYHAAMSADMLPRKGPN
ncbi:MAG: M20/M25/M40 family metallo-hydrolase [Gemmatimonadetes bacterium]|nr:M20/M25/M40 family metallo-hydrolase [Gemmatimonadota bacterium]